MDEQPLTYQMPLVYEVEILFNDGYSERACIDFIHTVLNAHIPRSRFVPAFKGNGAWVLDASSRYVGIYETRITDKGTVRTVTVRAKNPTAALQEALDGVKTFIEYWSRPYERPGLRRPRNLSGETAQGHDAEATVA